MTGIWWLIGGFILGLVVAWVIVVIFLDKLFNFFFSCFGRLW